MIVAGEQSGDLLGAGLIKAIKKISPECRFSGIGGELMESEGFQSFHAMDRLSVMGLIDPLKRLPELLRIRADIKTRLKKTQPDIFIGIDSPDFNLNIELFAKKCGVFSVHYVSPSVWAWRQGRIKKIKKAVDLMLTLLPFEADFYKQNAVPVSFIGHPLADELPLEPQVSSAKRALNLDESQLYLALLPGSRKAEVEHLLPVMVELAKQVKAEFPQYAFLMPAANLARKQEIQHFLEQHEEGLVKLIDGQSHSVMAASELVVMASGTTTLEAMLLKRPMVITYKVAQLTYDIISRLVKTRDVGLPNLLAGKRIVPEWIQKEATADNLMTSVRSYLASTERRDELKKQFYDLHLSIKKGASASAANAIVSAWQDKHD